MMTGEALAKRWQGDSSLGQGKSSPQGRLAIMTLGSSVGAAWEKCYECGQEGHFCLNCPFMNCSYGHVLAAGSQARKKGPNKLLVTLWTEGTPVTVTVDSGCSQMLVSTNLVKSSNPVGPAILLQHVHGDIQLYPAAWVRLADEHFEEIRRLGLALTLAYLLILG